MTSHPIEPRFGDGIVDLTVSPDLTRKMCQICFEFKTWDELADVADEPGRKWDVCAGQCAVAAGLRE